MCDKLLDEAIDKIPISTRKRKLFDNKPPLSDSSNMLSSVSSNICIISYKVNYFYITIINIG